jgi:hypothetical protein
MLLEIIILLLAIPTGLLIAHLTKDELKTGKKYFKIIIIASLLAAIWFYLTKNIPEALTSTFITLATFISFLKS